MTTYFQGFRVDLIGYLQEIIEWDESYAWLLTSTSQTAFRILPDISDLATKPLGGQVRWHVRLGYAGASSTDSITAKITTTDGTPRVFTTLNPTSKDNLDPDGTEHVFVFNLGEEEIGVDFYLSIEGPVNVRIRATDTTPSSGGELEYKNSGGSWVSIGTDQMIYGELYFNRVATFDITDDVREFTSEIGRSDIDGELVEGQGEITIDNKSGDYFPYDSSAAYYQYFDVNSRINVFAIYRETPTGSDIDYPLFKGVVQRIRPNVGFEKQDVQAMLSDRFTIFKDILVLPEDIYPSPTNATLVYLYLDYLLDAIYFPEDDRDIDTSIAEVVGPVVGRESLKAVDELQNTIEAVQNIHFIDRRGYYVYRSLQAYANGWTPDYTLDDDLVDFDDIQVEYDQKSMINRVQATGSGVANPIDYSDDASIARYGEKALKTDSEYFGFEDVAANYAFKILTQESAVVSSVTLIIENNYPNSIWIDVGDVIRVSSTRAGLSSWDGLVLSSSRKITRSKEHSVELKLKQLVKPPYVFKVTQPAEYWTGYHEGSAPLYFRTGLDTVAQSFVPPYSGELLYVATQVRTYLWGAVDRPVNVFIRADNSGNPGTILRAYQIPAMRPTETGTYDTLFIVWLLGTYSGGLPLTVSSSSTYWFQYAVGGGTTGRTYPYGTYDNVYTSGKMKWSLAGSAWQDADDFDFYIRSAVLIS